MSHLEVTHNMQSSGSSVWLLCILAFLSTLQLSPVAWEYTLPCILTDGLWLQDVLKSFWLRATQLISLTGKLRSFRIHFRNSDQSLHSEYSFLESILQLSISYPFLEDDLRRHIYRLKIYGPRCCPGNSLMSTMAWSSKLFRPEGRILAGHLSVKPLFFPLLWPILTPQTHLLATRLPLVSGSWPSF